MRYLVISDIHANLIAFQAVLTHAQGNYDRVWCLGDVIGYGPHPNECVEQLRQLDHVSLAGNHDWAVLGKLDFEDFNPSARFAVLWTRDQLKPEHAAYLADLPVSMTAEAVFTLVHASPRHPVLEYILDTRIAQVNFEYFETPYCLVGHTHSPAVYHQRNGVPRLGHKMFSEPEDYHLTLDGERLIINPGSVGQPRDGDARAAYAILDMTTMDFTIKRVAYHVSRVQELMKQQGFPTRLWKRLAFGY